MTRFIHDCGEMRTTLSRVRRFAGLGLALASILSAWIAVLALLGGSRTLQVRSASVDAVKLMLLYALGGCLGGAVVGLLLPLARWTLGCVLLGVLALLPVTLGIAYSSAASGAEVDYVAVALTAGILGAILGPAYKELFKEDLPN